MVLNRNPDNFFALRAADIEARMASESDPGTDVVSDRSVVTTTAAAHDFPDAFVAEFAAALARHRCWERQTDPVPA